MSRLHHTVIVWKEIEFDAGHRVPNHKSKCRNLHGHRYRVRAGVRGTVSEARGTSDEGMVLDFGDLKSALQVLHDEFDHKLVLYKDDPVWNAMHTHPIWDILGTEGLVACNWIPTAENFAIYCFDSLKSMFISNHWPMEVWEVQVYETPTSMASYSG